MEASQVIELWSIMPQNKGEHVCSAVLRRCLGRHYIQAYQQQTQHMDSTEKADASARVAHHINV